MSRDLHFHVTCRVEDANLVFLREAYQRAYQSDDDGDWSDFHNAADSIIAFTLIDIEPTTMTEGTLLEEGHD